MQHSFMRYFSNHFYVPGPALDIMDVMVIKLDVIIVLSKFTVTGEEIILAVSNMTVQ